LKAREFAKPFPYHRAGKNNLNDLQILPGALREGLFWGSAKEGPKTWGNEEGILPVRK